MKNPDKILVKCNYIKDSYKCRTFFCNRYIFKLQNVGLAIYVKDRCNSIEVDWVTYLLHKDKLTKLNIVERIKVKTRKLKDSIKWIY